MREIKFRAYDKEKKIMIHDQQQGLDEYYPKLKIGDYIPSLVRRIGEYYGTYMQHSALKDKNNNPIYESDIVKHNCMYTDKRDVLGVVKFGEYPDDEQYSTHKHYGWFIDEIKHDSEHSLIDLEVEVIGNIWQNPELLSKP